MLWYKGRWRARKGGVCTSGCVCTKGGVKGVGGGQEMSEKGGHSWGTTR